MEVFTKLLSVCLVVTLVASCAAKAPTSLSTVKLTTVPIASAVDKIGNSRTQNPNTKSYYSGPVKISIDTSIGLGAARNSAKRMVMDLTDSHNSNDAHTTQNQGLYFDPGKIASGSGVDPSYGDTIASSPVEPLVVSTSEVNGGSGTLNYCSGQIIVQARGSEDQMLARLREKYTFTVVSSQDGFDLLKVDLDGVSLDSLESDLLALNKINTTAIKDITFSSINSAKMAEVLADILLHDQDVIADAEWNMVSQTSTWSDKPYKVTPAGYADSYWWLTYTNTLPAWNYSIGTGVKVAIVDQGFDDLEGNPEFNRRLAGKGYFTSSGLAPGVSVDQISAGDDYHGSIVSYYALGEKNNGVGGCGVAPNASFYAYNCSGSVWSTAHAIKYAADQGADIINVSSASHVNYYFWIFEEQDQSFGDIVINNEMLSHPNLILVASAGNENEDTSKDWPQHNLNVLDVGGLSPTADSRGTKWTHSDYGNDVAIWAPAESCENSNPIAKSADFDHTDSGTSLSAPMVTGALALIKSRRNINIAQARQILADSATTTDDGKPMLNVEGAVATALGSGWLAKTFTGIIGYQGGGAYPYFLYINGEYYNLLDSVPDGTYEQFRNDAPSSAKDEFGDVYVDVTGWQEGNSIEVENIKFASVTRNVISLPTDTTWQPVAVQVPGNGGWNPNLIPGAEWIWDTTAFDNGGSADESKSFYLPVNTVRATLTGSVQTAFDDYGYIYLNGNFIDSGGNWFTVKQSGVPETDFRIGDTNTLRLVGHNGYCASCTSYGQNPAGIIARFDVEYYTAN